MCCCSAATRPVSAVGADSAAAAHAAAACVAAEAKTFGLSLITAAAVVLREQYSNHKVPNAARAAARALMAAPHFSAALASSLVAAARNSNLPLPAALLASLNKPPHLETLLMLPLIIPITYITTAQIYTLLLLLLLQQLQLLLLLWHDATIGM